MPLGFQGSRCGWRFDHATRADDRRIGADGRDRSGRFTAQVGMRGHDTLPAQAHVAAWVRPSAAQRSGPGRMNSAEMNQFFCFFPVNIYFLENE